MIANLLMACAIVPPPSSVPSARETQAARSDARMYAVKWRVYTVHLVARGAHYTAVGEQRSDMVWVNCVSTCDMEPYKIVLYTTVGHKVFHITKVTGEVWRL